MATRSVITESGRTIPRTRAAAQETLVRRTVAPARACTLRRRLDRRQRRHHSALRTGSLSDGLLPEARCLCRCFRTYGLHDPAPRTRTYFVVSRSRRRAKRAARGLAARQFAGLRERITRTGGLRVAGNGFLLRGRRTNPWSCRRQLPSNRHPADLP